MTDLEKFDADVRDQVLRKLPVKAVDLKIYEKLAIRALIREGKVEVSDEGVYTLISGLLCRYCGQPMCNCHCASFGLQS